MILGLVTCIYATMGVTFFGDDENKLFEDFTTALFTMFQVCTGDAWASEVARVFLEEDGRMMAGSTVFFVSYVLIAWCVLLNIVVAVLLDELFQKMAAKRSEDAKLAAQSSCHAHAMDPLMLVLSGCESMAELRNSIRSIFRSLDVDLSGSIGIAEMQEGLPRILPKGSTMYLNSDDWVEITNGFCDEGGNLAEHSFDLFILHHLKMYLMRNISAALLGATDASEATLISLKWLLMDSQAMDLADLRGDDTMALTPPPPHLAAGAGSAAGAGASGGRSVGDVGSRAVLSRDEGAVRDCNVSRGLGFEVDERAQDTGVSASSSLAEIQKRSNLPGLDSAAATPICNEDESQHVPKTPSSPSKDRLNGSRQLAGGDLCLSGFGGGIFDGGERIEASLEGMSLKKLVKALAVQQQSIEEALHLQVRS